MTNIQHYFSNLDKSKRLFNQWDILAFMLICAVIFVLAWGGQQMATPYFVGETIPLKLDPLLLPGYGVRTVLRMVIAMFFSLLFTFTIGTLAARSKRAELIIVPMIDVLQSVPVLTFLSITIIGFIRLFPGSLLGPECASIFAIFTAQAWNMALGFYQSLKTVPSELLEAAEMFHLSAWQRFWRVEVPFSMSSLLWNAMISMSASWFFVVASEAITVSNQDIRLPGIGSYIALAIDNADLISVAYAIIAMLVIIILFDQLIFRPLLQWSEKFQIDPTPEEGMERPWVVALVQRTRLLRLFGQAFDRFTDRMINISVKRSKPQYREIDIEPSQKKIMDGIWNILWISLFIVLSIYLIKYITSTIAPNEVGRVVLYGLATGLRVFILIALSSAVWLPIGVWIGMRPNLAVRIQPVIQFFASFPAYLLFPIVVSAIVRFHLNPEIWTAPLMILGSQWYILFNVIAGTLSLPKDIYYAANNFGVKGWLWWKRIAIPGILPFYVTGAITAAGGAWNASIVAEWMHWGNTVIRATGLGEYITQATSTGDFHRVALGTGTMCLLVILTNRILWRPLYQLAERQTHA